MFTLRNDKLGVFDVLTIENTQTGTLLSIVPAHGATPLRLTMGGQELLDGYQTEEELLANNWGKNVFLFPFPNRLRDGIFHWEGKEYKFPVKASAGQNAIHGFSRNKPYEVIKAEANQSGAVVVCRYRYNRRHKFFPFTFDFTITYELSANSLKVSMSVINKGRKIMPFGLGWHPYFTVADTANEAHLVLPPCQRVVVDERMLPTGSKTPYRHFEQIRPVGETFLDTCFQYTGNEPEMVVGLVGPRGALRYSQDNSQGLLPFFQIFTPSHRQSIAVEPMSCNVDAFNNSEGLFSLAPGESKNVNCEIQFTKP
jgi:aldose 1-epimerase